MVEICLVVSLVAAILGYLRCRKHSGSVNSPFDKPVGFGRYCVDCKWIDAYKEPKTCQHPYQLFKEPDRVTGDPPLVSPINMDCNAMRYGGICGHEGRWFEPRKCGGDA